MSILIRDAMLKGRKSNIYIEEDIITEIGNSKTEADNVIDGKGKEVIPAFLNGHTHSAMTFFRGYADDMVLHEWLTKKIWPHEEKMTEEEVYWGTKLACLEMIKSGTVYFNDMYWHYSGTYKAAKEAGLKGAVSGVFLDMFNKDVLDKNIKENKELFKKFGKDKQVEYALGPHSIYALSRDGLEWCRDFSEENNTLVHLHLSETEKEVKDCIEKNGCRPVEYLDKIGLLNERLVVCHSIWLNDKEIDLLAKNKVSVIHNPTSNMKLCSGKAIPFQKMQKAGLTVGLGTDGCASNNNLDMFEEMKFATNLQKFATNDPTVMNAKETFDMATINNADIFKTNSGLIEEGRKADILLIDLKRPELTPNYNIVSNLVYSANASCVDTTICDGKVLMQDRKVEGESELMQKASEIAKQFVAK